MARQALIVGEAAGGDDNVEQTLDRFGFSRVTRVANVIAAMEFLGHQHVDLVLVPVEELDEAHLGRLDRAIRRERHTAVIGTAPRADPEFMLRAMRAGIQEFLVRPLVPAELSASLERLVRRTETTTVNGQVYAVFGAKGGMGTSSVAVNLADSLARLHPKQRIAIADLVVGGGEARLLLNVNPPYDLGDVADKAGRIDAEMLKSVLVPAVDGVWLLAAPERPEAEDSIDATVVSNVIQELRQAYHHIVLDCERAMNDRTLAALDAAERIVLVTQLSVSSMRATQRSLAIFRRLGYPNDKLCIVINRYQSGEVISPTDAADLLKSEIFFKLPNDYKASSDASTRGLPLSIADAQSKLTWAYAQLAQKLSGGEAPLADPSGARSNGSGSKLRSLFSRKKG